MYLEDAGNLLCIHSFFQCLKIILYEAPGWWMWFAACMNDPILLHISEFLLKILLFSATFDFGLNPVAYFEGQR